MSKEEKTVLDVAVETLQKVAELLDSTQGAVWAVALELDAINERLKNAIGENGALKVDIDYEKLADHIVAAQGQAVIEETTPSGAEFVSQAPKAKKGK